MKRTLKLDSSLVPYDRIICGVRWQGLRVVLTPMDEDGNLYPELATQAGYRNRTGRVIHIDRSKYMPHQGKQECARRANRS